MVGGRAAHAGIAAQRKRNTQSDRLEPREVIEAPVAAPARGTADRGRCASPRIHLTNAGE
jgi:hypothetical protein